MLNKKYNFLAGFPRSGNTLLSALLNQNPNFYSSPVSPVCEHMFRMHNTVIGDHGLRNQENLTRTTSTLNKYMDMFYSDVQQPVVFDREKSWLVPTNLNLIFQYITSKPKILFTVRNYLDIVASYIRLAEADIVYEIQQLNLAMSDLPKYDQIAEYLSRINSELDLGMLSVRTGLKPEYKNYVHFVDYDELINNPTKTMKEIYTFLEEKFFDHNFNDIKKIEIDRDDVLNQNPLTHFVDNTLTPSQTVASEFFSDNILKKYSNMNIWKTSI